MVSKLKKHEDTLKKESKQLSGMLNDIEIDEMNFGRIRKYMISILYCMQWLEYHYNK